MEGHRHLVERHPCQLGPGNPVERQLERVCGLSAVGLPVDDQPGAVRLGVHRVDAPTHDLAGQDERERRFDRVRDPLREGAGLEAGDQLPQVVLVVDPKVTPARQVVGVEQGLLAEPGLDPGVEAGAEPRRRRGLARHRSGELAREPLGVVAQPRPPPWPTGSRAAAPRRRRSGRARASRSSRSSSASQSSTCADSTMSSPSSGPSGRRRSATSVGGPPAQLRLAADAGTGHGVEVSVTA